MSNIQCLNKTEGYFNKMQNFLKKMECVNHILTVIPLKALYLLWLKYIELQVVM